MIASEYPPLILGGVGAFTHELTLALAKRDIDVTVVTRSQDLMSQTNEGLVKVRRLYSPPIPPKDMWFYSTKSSRITEIVRQVNPDVIHDISHATGFLPWLTKNRKVVATIHGSPKISDVRRGSGSSEDFLRDILFKMAHSLPARFIGEFVKPDIKRYVHVSRFCLEDIVCRIKNPTLREMYLSKSEVIPNGVDVEKLVEIKKEALRQNDEDPLAITFVGRLMEYKGVRCLLRAFEKVLREIEGARLHIVGNGPLYQDSKAFIRRKRLESNILLHGALSRRDALGVVARTSFLVHPSFYESFGMVIAEAYALGKPAITHKAGYAAEMVEETGAGLTVNVIDVEALSNAITSLLTDTGLHKRLSANAEAAARGLFNIQATAKEYEQLFREVSD